MTKLQRVIEGGVSRSEESGRRLAGDKVIALLAAWRAALSQSEAANTPASALRATNQNWAWRNSAADLEVQTCSATNQKPAFGATPCKERERLAGEGEDASWAKKRRNDSTQTGTPRPLLRKLNGGMIGGVCDESAFFKNIRQVFKKFVTLTHWVEEHK